jgi:hypothetical protein
MFSKNNNADFQQIVYQTVWLIIPVYFGASNAQFHRQPVNKIVMATTYNNTTVLAFSHSQFS